MSPQTHERDIEEDVMLLFAELGWATGDLTREKPSTEGRTDTSWPYLPRRLKAALERLNPGFSKQALAAGFEELTRDRSSMSMVQANRELYRRGPNTWRGGPRRGPTRPSWHTWRPPTWRSCCPRPQNEVEDFKRRGLDILSHRQRM